MTKPKIGITIGDINGISPEVIIKALSNDRIVHICTPVIYGSTKVISYHRNIAKSIDFSFISTINGGKTEANKVNVVNCWDENVNINLGKATGEAGKYAHISLDRATKELQEGMIDAVVTAPINKKAMENSRFGHPGHTEYFTEIFGQDISLMMMVSDALKVGLATNHIPVDQITKELNKEILKKKLTVFIKSLKVDFGNDNPKIAILGLNPHASDDGKIGNEENTYIKPIIADLKTEGKLVFGPYSADGFFGSGMYKKFDGILAMYHDQGLIPFKTLSFGQGVNFTAGLPIVRTSPDHGTGYDIAGQNTADASSMREAIFLAIDIWRNRKDHKEMHAHAVEKKPKLTEEVEE